MNIEKFQKSKSNSFCSDSADFYHTVSSQKSFSFSNNNDTANMPSSFYHGQIAFEDGLQRLRQVRHS